MEQVTQADEERAVRVFHDGPMDIDDMAVEFARHRIEATQAKDEEIARLREALGLARDWAASEARWASDAELEEWCNRRDALEAALEITLA